MCRLVEEAGPPDAEGFVDTVHVTITHHETYRETALAIERWNRWFETYPDPIFQRRTAADVTRAQAEARTAIFFGSQNLSCIEDDFGLVEVLHTLGLWFISGPPAWGGRSWLK